MQQRAADERTVSSDEETLLPVAGPVRLGEVASLHERCLAAVEAGLPLRVDLENAEHLHAAALQVLRATELALGARGLPFRVQPVSAAAQHSLTLSGLTEWLEPQPSER